MTYSKNNTNEENTFWHHHQPLAATMAQPLLLNTGLEADLQDSQGTIFGPALRISLDDSFTAQVYQGPGHPLHPPSTPHQPGIFTWTKHGSSQVCSPDFGDFSIYYKKMHTGLAFEESAHRTKNFQFSGSNLPKTNVYQVRSFPTKIQVNMYHAWNTHHLVVSCLTLCFQFSLLFVWWVGFMLAIARIR